MTVRLLKSEPAEIVPPPLDKQAFARDLDALRKEIDASLGPADVAHMRRFEWAARACTLLGYATAWFIVNPLSVLLLSTGNFVRWAVVMHHVAHRGYDRVPGAPERYGSKRFAQGWRRFVDWLDWIPPEAWRYEHNALHHGHTNEDMDPDFVERNTAGIRTTPGPVILKYLQVAFFGFTWKFSYYMPTVLRAIRYARIRRAGTPSPYDTPDGLRLFHTYSSPEARAQWGELVRTREFWLQGVVPYAAVRFALIPALFLPLGIGPAVNVLISSLVAELLTNLHSFLTIVPNHAGSDLLKFDTVAGSRAELYWRQVVASANYTSPGAWSDFLQGGLNYQIEHHLWPDLPLSKYREYAPRVKELCARHGVPYRENPLIVRVGMLLDVAVGRSSLQLVDNPEELLKTA